MKSLISQIVEEEIHAATVTTESQSEFVKRVSVLCLEELTDSNSILPQTFTYEVLKEVEFEVTDVLRKKIYGFYNLDYFRQYRLKKRMI